MKRITYLLLLAITPGVGVTGCEKAHEAGNDSMNAAHGSVVASGSQVDTVREALAARPAATPGALASAAAAASAGPASGPSGQ
ncbi:hypothetical protein [Paraburkholderia sp. J76]|uniref:hypothetical protein n=1 Tax=Paraburkholderia sp. J76 TaxID=2805439 RepID=UPI002ABD5768|nr:hypothetical protein [Paraburkholderia sp. J76]